MAHASLRDVTMSIMASQITSILIICFTVCADADKKKHQSSASLAFVRGIHQWPVNSFHKGPLTPNRCLFADLVMFLALKWLFVNKAKQNKTDQMHRLNWNIQFNVWISWAKYVNKLFCLWWVLCWTGNLEHNSHYIWWAILRFFWRRSALTWWRHQTKTFSTLLALCGGNSPVTGEFSSQRPVTQSFDASLICSWINGWLNNREAGDLRRYHAYDDVTVMDVLPLITGDSSASDDVMSHIAAMTDDTVGKRRGSMNQNITSLFSWVRLGTSKPWVNVDWILYLWHHGTKIKLWYFFMSYGPSESGMWLWPYLPRYVWKIVSDNNVFSFSNWEWRELEADVHSTSIVTQMRQNVIPYILIRVTSNNFNYGGNIVNIANFALLSSRYYEHLHYKDISIAVRDSKLCTRYSPISFEVMSSEGNLKISKCMICSAQDEICGSHQDFACVPWAWINRG